MQNMHHAMSSTPQTDSPKGLAYAVAAYGLWGFLPIYMKALAHLPAAEIIAHRIVWSLPIAAAVLLWQGRAAEVGQALRQPRLLAMAALTAVLLICRMPGTADGSPGPPAGLPATLPVPCCVMLAAAALAAFCSM